MRDLLRLAAASTLVIASSLRAQNATTQPAAFAEQDVIAARLAFENEFVLDAYRKSGHRDATWDADAIALLTAEIPAGLDAVASRFSKLPNVAPLDARAALAKRILAGRCDDAAVLYEAGRVFREEGLAPAVAEAFERADKAVDASPYVSPVKLWVVDAAAAIAPPGEAAAYRARFDALARAIVADHALLPDHRRGVWQATCDLLLPAGDEAAALATGDAIERVPDADPWMYETLMGSVETTRAWHERTSNASADVTDAGWKGFAAHLAAARHHFEKAIEADDAWPQPFFMMIVVAKGESAGNERQWFELARDRQCDSAAAASEYLNARLPRWGGSYVEMLDAGVRNVDAGRFDTRGPSMLLDAVEMIEQDSDTPLDARQLQRVYAPIARCLDGYATQNARPEVRRWARSLHAAWAVRLEKWTDAQTQFAALASAAQTVEVEPFDAMNLLLKDVQPKAAVYGGAYGDAVRAAMAKPERERGDALAAVLATVDPADAGHAWLAERQAAAAITGHLTTGDWVAVPIPKDLTGWQSARGAWSVDAYGVLVGIGDRGLSIVAPVELPARCDVRMTIQVDTTAAASTRPSSTGPSATRPSIATVSVRAGLNRVPIFVSLNFDRGTGSIGGTPFDLPDHGALTTFTLYVENNAISLLRADGTVLAKTPARTPVVGKFPQVTVTDKQGRSLKLDLGGSGAPQSTPPGAQALSISVAGPRDGRTWRFSAIAIRVPK